ncbi:MAG: hypothetical protein H0T42_09160 [Deltaproteobacteria bacterium]|nr:hypothetical protein [Deltaproteobacteria bacterium]
MKLASLVLVLGSTGACKKASPSTVDQTPAHAGSAVATPPAGVPAGATLDQVIAHAFGTMTVNEVQVRHVGANGRLDRAHGEVFVLSMYPTDKRGDEAKRRLGAPIEWNADTMYAKFTTWNSVLNETSTTGYHANQALATRPACTVGQVWKRALAAGAPVEALAKITLKAGADGRAQHWLFTVTDVPRKTYFRLEVADDCPAILEAGGN